MVGGRLSVVLDAGVQRDVYRDNIGAVSVQDSTPLGGVRKMLRWRKPMCRVTWEQLPATPARHLCLKQVKIFQSKTQTANNGCQIRTARGNNVQVPSAISSGCPRSWEGDLLPSMRTIDEHSGGACRPAKPVVVNDVRGHNQGDAERESISGCDLILTKKTFQKHQEHTRNMYPLLNQALRQLPDTRGS